MTTKRLTGQEMAEQLSNFVNVATPTEMKAFAQTVASDHRTLQSDTFKLFTLCMKEWSTAYQENRYDERNAWSCKASKHIVKMLDDGI